MKNRIEISLEWKGKQEDLVIPANVTAERLVDVLSEAFQVNEMTLPNYWYFIVKGKRLALESGRTLKELGVGDGAVLEMIVGEKNEML